MQPLAAVPPFGRWAAAFGRWAVGGGLLRSVGGTAQSAASYAAVATIAYAIARWPPSMLLRLLPRLLHGPSRRPKQQRALSEGEFVPPLPEPVVQVLTRCCLCFLATSNDSAPHLSLMRFSFSSALDDPEKEVVIVSTRRNTKKYQFILENKEVALLVHDFSGEAEEDGQNYEELEGRARHSITLNGIVHEQTGELAERYRAIHLTRNQAYAQFITGDDIAILTVEIVQARVCDVHDTVRHYERDSATPGRWSLTRPITAGPPSQPSTRGGDTGVLIANRLGAPPS